MIDWNEAARRSGFVRDGHIEPLIRSLKLKDYGWLIQDAHISEERLQGDIFTEFPLAYVAPTGRYVGGLFTAMVLNNSCDLQPHRSDYVNAAQVQDFESFVASANAAYPDHARQRGFLNDVASNKIDEFLYLPNCPQLPRGAVVCLDRISTLHVDVYEAAISAGKRVASLTQCGFYFMLMKFTRYFLRTESPDIAR